MATGRSRRARRRQKGALIDAREAARLQSIEFAQRVRGASEELAGKAQLAGAAFARQAAEAGSDFGERASEFGGELGRQAQARGQLLASRTQQAIKEADLERRALEAAAAIKASQLGTNAAEVAGRALATGDRGAREAGRWLGSGERAKRLRLVTRRRSRTTTFLGLLLGFAAGAATAMLTRRDSREDEDLFARSEPSPVTPAPEIRAAPADPLAPPVATEPVDPAAGASASPGEQAAAVTSAQSTAPATGTPVAEEVRARLESDERTRELEGLQVNVADGTVFVRGNADQPFDEQAVRDVIQSVPGVRDVDLQVETAS